MAIRDRKSKPYIEDRDQKVSIGIDLPFRLATTSGSGYFAQTSTTIDAVKVNIKNLLTTEAGERYLQPELGLNLKSFLFENINENLKTSIEEDVRSTFARWLPFVQVREIIIDISETESGANRIKINVIFNINRDTRTLNSVQVE